MNRTITYSGIEPAGLSWRAPAGVDVTVDILMKRQDGEAVDLGLVRPVLQVEPRSGGAGVTYAGTYDVSALGAAAFVVPGSGFKDPNGYRLSLWGVVDGVYQLLARGLAAVTPAMNAPSTSGAGVPTSRGIFDLNIIRNDSWTWQFTLWGDSAKTVPSDLTGATVTAQVRSTVGGPILASLGVEIRDAVGGVVWMSMSGGQSGVLPATSYWDLQIAYPTGDVRTPVSGRVIVTDDVTRP